MNERADEEGARAETAGDMIAKSTMIVDPKTLAQASQGSSALLIVP